MGELPSFLVDAPRFAAAMERLHLAVERSGGVAIGALATAVHHDRATLGSRMREFCSGLSKLDLERARQRSSALTELRSGQEAAELRRVSLAITGAWKQRLVATLGTDRMDALRELLRDDVPDMLGVLDRQDDENSHSDVIAWLLHPRRAPGVAPFVLSALAAFLPEPMRWRAAFQAAIASDQLTVRRELTIGRDWDGTDDKRRLDIVVTGPGLFLAIENKLWSIEHEAQTHDYWEWMKSLGDRTLRAGIYLSPAGAPAGCSDFIPISYLSLVGTLLEARVSGFLTGEERLVLAGYIKTIARHVLATELRVLVAEGDET